MKFGNFLHSILSCNWCAVGSEIHITLNAVLNPKKFHTPNSYNWVSFGRGKMFFSFFRYETIHSKGGIPPFLKAISDVLRVNAKCKESIGNTWKGGESLENANMSFKSKKYLSQFLCKSNKNQILIEWNQSMYDSCFYKLLLSVNFNSLYFELG